MLYILTGSRSQANQQYIAALEREFLGLVRQNVEIENLVSAMSQEDLFAPRRLLVAAGAVKQVVPEAQKLAASNHIIVICADDLPAGHKLLQPLAKIPAVTLVDFPELSGKQLEEWVMEAVKARGGKITLQTVRFLLERLGALEKDLPPELELTLTQEIAKLCTAAAGQEINQELIVQLVSRAPRGAAFDILSALAAKQKSRAFALIEDFYIQSTGDEKATTILLCALLAEQLRAMLIVMSAAQQKIADQEVLKDTGWKPGRLYMVKKNAAAFTLTQVQKALSQLVYTDLELKSSAVSGRVLLDLIVNGLMK